MDDRQIVELAARVILAESAAVAGLAGQLPAELPRAVRLLFECRVTSSSPGRAPRTPWRCASPTCSPAAGRQHSSCTPGDSQHGAAGALRPEDVWIGLSKGGETAEVCFLAGIARKRGAKVIAITEKPASTLGQLADVVLEIHAPADVDPYGMIATGSSLFNSAFCDAICVALLELRGYTRDAFGETHPGGAVGHTLRAVEAP